MRFDTVFDILRRVLQFLRFFFDIFDTILRCAFYRAIQLKFRCAKYRAYRAFSILPTPGGDEFGLFLIQLEFTKLGLSVVFGADQETLKYFLSFKFSYLLFHDLF